MAWHTLQDIQCRKVYDFHIQETKRMHKGYKVRQARSQTPVAHHSHWESLLQTSDQPCKTARQSDKKVLRKGGEEGCEGIEQWEPEKDWVN